MSECFGSFVPLRIKQGKCLESSAGVGTAKLQSFPGVSIR